jgi:hypothetical protein
VASLIYIPTDSVEGLISPHSSPAFVVLKIQEKIKYGFFPGGSL